jgi:hypothetical protein
MTMIVYWLLGVCMFIGVAITWRMYEAGTVEHNSDYSSQLYMLVEQGVKPMQVESRLILIC